MASNTVLTKSLLNQFLWIIFSGLPFHENTSLRPQKQHRYFIHPKVLDSCHLSDLFLNLSPEYFVFSIYCFQRVAPTVNLNPRAIQFSSNLKNAVCIIMPRTVHQIFIVYFLHLQQCLKTKSIMGPMTRWVDIFQSWFCHFFEGKPIIFREKCFHSPAQNYWTDILIFGFQSWYYGDISTTWLIYFSSKSKKHTSY